MRQRLSHVTTGAAISVIALALISSFNSLPAAAAATGSVVETAGSNTRHHGNTEHVVDGVPARIDEQLLFFNGGNGEGELADVAANEDGYDREEDEVNDGFNFNAVKRKWGQKNLALWGKRRLPYSDDDNDIFSVKRKWGQKNMALWGKRAGHFDDEVSADKRKWGQKNMALWGRK